MAATVTRLHPEPLREVPLEGLYLAHSLDRRRVPGRAFVYSTFVTSADGRVAVGSDDGAPARGVPEALANPRDWRLYQELVAQADVVLTTGRYIRDRAAGEAGPIITYDSDPAMADILAWRAGRGRPPRPALAVVSRSLDFDEEAALDLAPEIVAVGSSAASRDRVAGLEARGIRTLLGRSSEGVSGAEIAAGLAGRGYATAFSAAGPQLAHLLAAAGVLDVLYVTQVLKLLGGRSYVTFNEGHLFDTPQAVRMESLYFDRGSGDGLSQLFASFEPES